MAILRAADLEPESFLRFIRDYGSLCEKKFSEMPLMMAFSPARAIFDKFDSQGEIWQSTDQGRIFSLEGELKWRRIDGRFRVVFLGEIAPPDGLKDFDSKMEGLTPETVKLILWGVRKDKTDEWIEQTVSHRFKYRISTDRHFRGRVAAVVENWNDKNGFARFSRYRSIEEIPGEA